MSGVKMLDTSLIRTQVAASEEEIAAAESELSVKFPLIYKAFLRHHGVVNVYDRCIYGLGKYTKRRDRKVCSVVFETQFARIAIGLASHLVVIWDESHLDFECLDTSRVTSDGDCPIVLVDVTPSGRARKPRQIAASFSEWLEQIVERQRAAKQLLDREMPGQLTRMGNIRTPRAKQKRVKKRQSRKKP